MKAASLFEMSEWKHTFADIVIYYYYSQLLNQDLSYCLHGLSIGCLILWLFSIS
jgi:hypothetical protein